MKCFYHSADLDGHCSGAIVKYFHPECEMFPINYGQVFPWDKITIGEQIFMVDFSLQPFADMIKLDRNCKLIWIDHHKTAIEEATKKWCHAFNGIQRDGLGACALTWEFCLFKWADKAKWADEAGKKNLSAPPLAVRLLAEYDVWNHRDIMTLPFQYGLRLKDTSPENQTLWIEFFECGFEAVEPFLHMGSTIIEYESQTNAKFCKGYAFETKIEVPGGNMGTYDLRAICVNRGFTNSKIFDSVWDPEKYDLMITFCRLPLPKKMWTVSLYSDKPDVDCGAIAKSFGGGGHKGAAGFQCQDLPFEY